MDSPAGENDSNSRMFATCRNIHNIISNIPPLEDLKEDSAYEMGSGSEFAAKEGNSKDLSEVPKAGEKQTKSSKLANSVLSASSIAKNMKSKFTK